MPGRRRPSDAALDVVAVMIREPSRPWYGLELVNETDLAGGTVYPILARLEGRGWLRSEREEHVDAARPARRYYLLTTEGLEGARRELGAAPERARARPARLSGPVSRPEAGA